MCALVTDVQRCALPFLAEYRDRGVDGIDAALLGDIFERPFFDPGRARGDQERCGPAATAQIFCDLGPHPRHRATVVETLQHRRAPAVLRPARKQCGRQAGARCRPGILVGRSEEHTSELQSLMRISYAVFCLKKKKKHVEQSNYDEYM